MLDIVEKPEPGTEPSNFMGFARYAFDERVKNGDLTIVEELSKWTKEEIGKYRDLEFAVLVNGSTASAAELFTSALMDHGLSVTVGTNTYGKGTMQTTYSLARYGYSGALKLTTQYYDPPFSDSYDGKGITPDRVVELDEALAEKNIYKITDEEDNQLLSAIEELYKK